MKCLRFSVPLKPGRARGGGTNENQTTAYPNHRPRSTEGAKVGARALTTLIA